MVRIICFTECTIIPITLTNGVSFSLVAGACCIVVFNNATYTNAAQYASVTLNINSTGAKKFSKYEVHSNGKSYMSYDGPAVIELSRSGIVTYNGNTYVGLVYAIYGDYSD